VIVLFYWSITILSASGGYDNGTSTGKGKIQVDLTWNPQNLIKYGQTYVVVSYGITNRLDIHGFLSRAPSEFETCYAGVFYQFLDLKRLDLATAVGVRGRFEKNWTHLFFPQLLYTIHFSEYIYLGGSLVNLKEYIGRKIGKNIGVAVDIGIFFRLPYQSKLIESISVGIGGFHPVTYQTDSYFLPTYSIDIKFKRFYKSK